MALKSSKPASGSGLTAIFLDKDASSSATLKPFLDMIRVMSPDYTILLPESSLSEKDESLPDNVRVFRFEPDSKSSLAGSVRKALEYSPASSRFLIFFGSGGYPNLGEKDLLNLANSKYDIVTKRGSDCMAISRNYANYIASVGQEPSIESAIKAGFSVPMMSLFEMISSPREAIRRYSTLIKFLCVGASGAAVQLVVLTILKIWINPLVANGIAIEVSIVNNFIWNDRFTFAGKSSLPGSSLNSRSGRRIIRFAKYNVVSLGSFAVNEGVYSLVYLFYFHSAGRFSYIISALVGIVAGFTVNYLGSSRWAWRRSRVVTDSETAAAS
jgi:putative flippase GtrA